jgi:hypothetical protein
MNLLALLSLAEPAAALELRYWGLGGAIGTMAIPTNYPIGLPANAETEPTDQLPDGLRVAKVKGDVGLAARGVVYPSNAGRVNARIDFGFGTNGFNRQEVTVGYDVVAFRDEELHLLFGGGLGAGTEMFPSLEAYEGGTGFLRANYFPLRANVAGVLRLPPSAAVELGLYGTFHIVGEQLWYDERGDSTPESGSDAAKDFLGGGVAGGAYAAIGAEATVYFGDWKPGGNARGDSGRSKKK